MAVSSGSGSVSGGAGQVVADALAGRFGEQWRTGCRGTACSSARLAAACFSNSAQPGAFSGRSIRGSSQRRLAAGEDAVERVVVGRGDRRRTCGRGSGHRRRSGPAGRA